MYRFPSFKHLNELLFHEQYDGVNGKMFWWLMKKINFWLRAGWVASSAEIFISTGEWGSRCQHWPTKTVNFCGQGLRRFPWQGWGQIRFIKYKYKYKYKNLDFSNTNTNTNIFFNFDSNTNTSIQIQIQIQIRSTKYICRNCSGSKIGQFYKSQDICSWPLFPYV